MDTSGTQYSRVSQLTTLHHGGSITHKEDGVHFRSRNPQLWSLAGDIDYAGLIEKLTPKVQLLGDEQEIIGILYRRPSMSDNNTVQFSTMEVKNDDDVKLMQDTQSMYEDRVRRPLELYIITRSTIASIRLRACMWRQ